MSKEKQIDIIIDLLTEFDEMGFIPTTTVPNPEAYAIKWRDKITKAFEDYHKQSEGEWIRHKENCLYNKCSVCEYEHCREDNFCPNCGAKMKGEDMSGLYKNTKGARIETLNDYKDRMNQKRKQELEQAREYFKDILRVLIDNFGIEKHPEKIEAVKIAIELIEKEIQMENV